MALHVRAENDLCRSCRLRVFEFGRDCICPCSLSRHFDRLGKLRQPKEASRPNSCEIGGRRLDRYKLVDRSRDEGIHALGVHGPVMRKLLNLCDEAALVHWTQDGAELPSWDQAHQRIQREGRRSKVNHPSAGHAAYEIPTPKISWTGELRLK